MVAWHLIVSLLPRIWNPRAIIAAGDLQLCVFAVLRLRNAIEPKRISFAPMALIVAIVSLPNTSQRA